MPATRFIFFDVGNTLLFPNRPRILAPLPAERHPTMAQWQALERKTKAEFDPSVIAGKVDQGFWWAFHTDLLNQLDVHDDQLRDQLVENTQSSTNWDQMLPGTPEALRRIGSEFGIAVISNADGGIERVLTRCGIADCFRSIIDSGIVGYEKPHPAIFEQALAAMKARPEESLYVGDVYSVDYLGARNAGMDAVLFDVAGVYAGRDLPRVDSLAALETWLHRQPA